MTPNHAARIAWIHAIVLAILATIFVLREMPTMTTEGRWAAIGLVLVAFGLGCWVSQAQEPDPNKEEGKPAVDEREGVPIA